MKMSDKRDRIIMRVLLVLLFATVCVGTVIIRDVRWFEREAKIASEKRIAEWENSKDIERIVYNSSGEKVLDGLYPEGDITHPVYRTANGAKAEYIIPPHKRASGTYDYGCMRITDAYGYVSTGFGYTIMRVNKRG